MKCFPFCCLMAISALSGCQTAPETRLEIAEIATTVPPPMASPAPISTAEPTEPPQVIRSNRSALPVLPQRMDNSPRPTFVPLPTPKIRPGQTIIVSNARATPTPRENPTIIVSNAPVAAGAITASAAAARGLVWVNTASRDQIYHRPGGRFYGGTRDGYYTSEAQARSRGYRASER